MIGTFNIRTGPHKSDVRPHPYEEEFTLFNEVWVTHRRLFGIGFALSHKETGLRVPQSERERAVESKHHGSEYLKANEERIAGVLAKVRA